MLKNERKLFIFFKIDYIYIEGNKK